MQHPDCLQGLRHGNLIQRLNATTLLSQKRRQAVGDKRSPMLANRADRHFTFGAGKTGAIQRLEDDPKKVTEVL